MDTPFRPGDGGAVTGGDPTSLRRAGAGVLPSICALVLATLTVTGCGERGEAGSKAPVRGARPAPVLVQPVAMATLTHRVEGTGSLEAYQVVTVAARVEGVVESVAFDEGDAVDPT